LLASLISVEASAAVILSSCPVRSTTEPELHINRFQPNAFTVNLRNYAREVPAIQKYLAWLLKRSTVTSQAKADAKEMGLTIEDVQLSALLNETKPVCHSEEDPVTDAKAIFPFVLRGTDDKGASTFQVRFKLCEYYVDHDRQLPIENACEVLGRRSGYTFAQLENRLAQLQSHVIQVQDGLHAAAYAAGVLASFTSFKILRVVRVGALPALAFGTLPALGSVFAVRAGWTDEFARDMIDLKSAAELPVTGNLTTNVVISRPIQDFIPYFVRYLDSIDPGAASAFNEKSAD
jgi:hypothetical protein